MYKRINELLGTEYKKDSEIDWYDISVNYNLSESFIEDFSNELEWASISSYQVLSEDFIRKYKDKVNWKIISYNQILSWDFMIEFKDRLRWDYISASQPFIDPSFPMIDNLLLPTNKLYLLYQRTKERGWFICFREVNIDRGELSGFYNIFYDLVRFRRYRFQKVRVHWKDLVKLKVTRGYEFIREVKYV